MIDIYDYRDYYDYDDLDDVYRIATDDSLPSGVYVNINDQYDMMLKEFDEKGRALIGFSQELTSAKTLYRATDGGGMIFDESTLVSTSKSEEHLVMADILGLDNFILVKITYDRHINAISWYGRASQFKVKFKGKKRIVI